MNRLIAGKTINDWIQQFPLLEQIKQYQPVYWENAGVREDLPGVEKLKADDITDAAERWKRFAPLLKELFPTLQDTEGKVVSPLRRLDRYKAAHLKVLKEDSPFFLKCDNQLPVAGSIKARGGMYEVLKHAESLALKEGLLKQSDDYRALTSPACRQFFSRHSIGVGSTGNLALSIGIVGTALGFEVHVHMSSDAKQWKKDLLRKHGAQVHEYKGDFSEAITKGRQQTEADPAAYFIDDEDSKDLFLGYSVAAAELKQQLDAENVFISEQNPLFVYLPCGVGGAPGGIAYGLKQLFGGLVHCVFVEPTHAPAVLLGLMTGLHEGISVQDFDLDNRTAADGLAVGRPSRFASSISQHTVSSIYTENDDIFYQLTYELWNQEGIFLEPSAAAGLSGPNRIQEDSRLSYTAPDGVHVAWATGGALVPDSEREVIYQKGKQLAEKK
ncbi:D-serine ammonia-lyase [Sediminibacillus halophilus]|uniref:Probable D-serine dehydratase n=1 Tax=Sediminibacillus halophilus TaxID=482461 RepID=A0A1G9NMJ4_9BACI|nr:D-serine ammonia-lyase [Sediminibacillus halophilus]SDL87610.1 D-serine ammonia-lyase [Sediminibacillus halophilus]